MACLRWISLVNQISPRSQQAGWMQYTCPFFLQYDDTTNSLWVAELGAAEFARFPDVLVNVNNTLPTLSTQLRFLGRTPSAYMFPEGE